MTATPFRLSLPGRGRAFETGLPEVDAVAREKNARWITLAGVSWRSLALLVTAVGSLGWLAPLTGVLVVVAAVLALNLRLLVAVAGHRAGPLLSAGWFFAADTAMAAALVVCAGAAVPERSVYVQDHDLFNPYIWGTLMLWTGLRGVRTGLVLLLCAALPVQLGMALLNGYPFGAPGWGGILARDLWLLTSFVVAATIATLARQTAYYSAEAGVRAGREGELLTLHETALATLDAIVLESARQETPAEERLRTIREAATRQVTAIRAALTTTHPQLGLRRALANLAVEFVPRGLTVELVLGDLKAEPSAAATDAAVRAAREALSNTVKHSGTRRAVLRLATRGDAFRITVRDHGRGCPTDPPPTGYGLTHAVIAGMRSVGGHAEIWSEPGEGTKVTLWGPIRR